MTVPAHDLAAGFALDALDPDESSAFEDHLPGCPRCEDEVEPLRFVAAALAFAGPIPPPRPALRLRVLEVGAPVIPLHRRFRVQLLSAAAVATMWLGLATVFHPWGGGAQAAGSVMVSPTGEAVLVVHHLKPAPAGKVYEAWIVDHGRIAPAGVLDGSVFPLTRRVPRGAGVLVSLEPAGGSPQPTGTVVLKAETA
jgi:hypothetical protein